MRILAIALLLSLTSCASTLMKKNYHLKVYSTEPNAKAGIGDTVYRLPARVKVRRSKEDLQIRLITDTITEFKVRASPNPAFVYGNLLWAQACPVAYFIDFTNPKRFYYGRSIYLDPNDSIRIIRTGIRKRFGDYFAKEFPEQKGTVNLSLTAPHINSFYVRPDGEPSKSTAGFWGISAGVDYYYTGNRYFSMNAGAVTDFFLPLPAPVDISGEFELITSVYAILTDNHRVKRFHFGYGLSYAINTWHLKYSGTFDPPPPTREPVSKTSHSIGISLHPRFQLMEFFFAGIHYRPTFLRVRPDTEFRYEHLISFDLAFKIRLKK